jgi:isochorismate pyruvate lyase
MPVNDANSESPERRADALLAPLRREIDAVDAQIIALLAQRFEIVGRVAAVKAAHGIAPVLRERIEHVVSRARAGAELGGFDPDVADRIYRLLIDAAIRVEEKMIHSQKDS